MRRARETGIKQDSTSASGNDGAAIDARSELDKYNKFWGTILKGISFQKDTYAGDHAGTTMFLHGKDRQQVGFLVIRNKVLFFKCIFNF